MREPGKLGSTVIYILTRPFAILPLGFHRACGKLIAWLCGEVIGYRKGVIMTNLARSFPEKGYDELQDICKRFYAHFGKIFGEAIWFGGGNGPSRIIKSGIVKISNPEVLNGLYDKGKSVFLMSSHNGNWELYGGYASYSREVPLKYKESDMCVVYRRLASPSWDRFMNRNRIAQAQDRANYKGMIETFNVLRFAIRHRHEQKLYMFITDQYPYSQSSKVKIGKFLNQETLSMDGAPALAKKLGMAVVYSNMMEEEDGSYTISFTPICEDAGGWTVQQILEKYYALLEEDIRKQPWNYLWTHKRWK